MLEMRDRELACAGLSTWLPGRGLTGLMMPDMYILGVGGCDERASGTGFVATGGSGDGDAGAGDAVIGAPLLPKSERSVFFWSIGTLLLLSNDDGI